MMQPSTLDLSILTGDSPGGAMETVPRPRSRWKTRVVLPVIILASAGGLFVYAARDVLVPSVGIWVAPVVAKPIGSSAEIRSSSIASATSKNEWGPLLVQAPGWIEPAPYAINVPALAEGVIKEVSVLEGDAVETGQVIARMVDDDARLSLRAAEAELAALQAEASKAEFDFEASKARAAELHDLLKRSRELVTTGGVPVGELAQLEYRAQAAERETDGAKAAIDVKKATVVRQEVVLDEARLLLSRMEIRSPGPGIILARLIEPGARISMSSRALAGSARAETMSGTIARIYDPAKLQVRAEIPLADSAKVDVGSRAQITTEALPETTLHGTVTRVVHEANIQRNTIQVKILIIGPLPALKPEMLAKVRLYAPATGSDVQDAAGIGREINHSSLGTERPVTNQSGLQLVIPVAAIINRQADSANVWAVNKLDSGESRAELRTVTLAGETVEGDVEILQGVRVGDRVITDPPPELGNGDRIRVLGERRVGARKEQ